MYFKSFDIDFTKNKTSIILIYNFIYSYNYTVFFNLNNIIL